MKRTIVSDDSNAGRSEARLLSVWSVGHSDGEQRRRGREACVRCGSGVFGSIHLSVFTAGGLPRYVSSETCDKSHFHTGKVTFPFVSSSSLQDRRNFLENAFTAGTTEIQMLTEARGCWWLASAILEAILPWRSADVQRW